MAATAIRKIAVIGAGQMGGGIAQTAALAARIPTVLLYDSNGDQLAKQHRQIGMNQRGPLQGRSLPNY